MPPLSSAKWKASGFNISSLGEGGRTRETGAQDDDAIPRPTASIPASNHFTLHVIIGPASSPVAWAPLNRRSVVLDVRFWL